MASTNAPGLRRDPRPKYLALAVAAVQRAIAYRGTTVLNLLSGLVWVAVLYYLWRAVYSTHTQIGNFDWRQMQTYILVGYAVNALISLSSAMRMLGTIRTGEVATELLRPVDYLKAQLAQTVGSALIEGALSASIVLLLGIFLLDLAPPASPLAALLFALSIGLGFLIKFLISFMVALLCFWTLNGLGLVWAQTAIVNIFSGALIPLSGDRALMSVLHCRIYDLRLAPHPSRITHYVLRFTVLAPCHPVTLSSCDLVTSPAR